MVAEEVVVECSLHCGGGGGGYGVKVGGGAGGVKAWLWRDWWSEGVGVVVVVVEDEVV